MSTADSFHNIIITFKNFWKGILNARTVPPIWIGGSRVAWKRFEAIPNPWRPTFRSWNPRVLTGHSGAIWFRSIITFTTSTRTRMILRVVVGTGARNDWSTMCFDLKIWLATLPTSWIGTICLMFKFQTIPYVNDKVVPSSQNLIYRPKTWGWFIKIYKRDFEEFGYPMLTEEDLARHRRNDSEQQWHTNAITSTKVLLYQYHPE